MVTGEKAGLWGDITNTNLNILQQAIAGYEQVSVNATSAITLAFTNAALSNGKNAVLEITGTPSANATVNIPDGIEKTYTIKNSTVGSSTLTIKTTSGNGTTFLGTDKGTKLIYSDGTDITDTFSELSQINLVNQNEVRFQDATGGEYVGLKAPATVTSSFTLNLPSADSANNGYGLTTDGSGNLSFTDVASTGKAIAMALVFG
jgi:hypothetical protein